MKLAITDLDITSRDEIAALRRMLDALDAQGVGQAVTMVDLRNNAPRHFHPPAGSELEAVGDVVRITPRERRPNPEWRKEMDETADLGNVPPAPTPAVADPSSTAPVDLSVFSAPQNPADATPAASAPLPPAPPAPAAPMSPASTGGMMKAAAEAMETMGKILAVTPGIERDSAGIPYDARIHSSKKTKIADGTWRQRRNLPDGLREQVEAELRGRSTTAGAPSIPTAPAATVGASPTPAVTPAAASAAVATIASPTDTAAAPAASAVPLPPTPGVSDATLPATTETPAPTASTPVPPAPAAPAPAPVPLPPATPTGTPPVAASAAAVGSWVELIQLYTSNVGVLDQAEVDQMAKDQGYAGVMFMGQAPVEHIQAVARAIGEKLA